MVKPLSDWGYRPSKPPARHPHSPGMKRYLQSVTKKSEATIIKFLSTLAEGWSLSRAAQVAGISVSTARNWRRDDEEFAKRWDEAVEQGTDRLEDEAFRRAYEGVEKPLFHQGQMVATIREHSDRLMELMLKGRRRAKWGDKVGLTGGDPGDEPIKVAAVVRVIVGADGKVIEHEPNQLKRPIVSEDTDG